MRGIVTEITKSEFLQACNEKVRLDGLQDAEEERRRREEAERIARENSEWDAWYRNVPNACKRGFDVGDFRYSIDANQRKIYKTSNLGGTVIGFTSEGINEELGI